MDPEILKKLIEDDDLGLLAIKPRLSPEASASERLKASFLEIVDFVEKNNREPFANKADIKEMMLYSRLSGLRQDAEKIDALKDHDHLGLLSNSKSIESLEDIFDDDDIGLLTDSADDIFSLKNVPASRSIENTPDYKAKRKPCKNFSKFEPLFVKCQKELSVGFRKLTPFSSGSQIGIGEFFVLKGVLVYVASEHERENQPGAELGKMNDRLHCIFENGTESDMLRRSLSARLYEGNGLRVSANVKELFQTQEQITSADQNTGFVYVLKSLSEKPDIKSLKNLYKIGFSRGPVEDRIKKAQTEPTFLMAPVSIVATYQCYNFNPQRLEQILHTFFGSACLQIEITDSKGITCYPKEWFIAPLDIVNSAIQLLISGDIRNFRYNPDLQEIEPRPVEASEPL